MALCAVTAQLSLVTAVPPNVKTYALFLGYLSEEIVQQYVQTLAVPYVANVRTTRQYTAAQVFVYRLDPTTNQWVLASQVLA